MDALSLATDGVICHGKYTMIKRWVLPLQLQIQDQKKLDLSIIDKLQLNLDVKLIDKNINLKVAEDKINIKKINNLNVNLKD